MGRNRGLGGWRAWRAWSTDERRLVLAALGLWPICRLTLRRRGAQAARDRLFGARLAEGPRVLGAAPGPRRVAQLVDGVCRRLPGNPTCLERSLITAALLRRRGVDAQLQIGVRRGPDGMDFHAWVTVGTEVINDGEQRVAEYRPLALAGPQAGR